MPGFTTGKGMAIITIKLVTISIDLVIHLLKQAEKDTADFYDTIALDSLLRFPELSALFSSLAEEEIIHLRIVEMAQVYQKSDNAAFVENHDAQLEIRAFLEFVAERKKAFLDFSPRLTEKDILMMAEEIEKHLVERHRNMLLAASDPVLCSLLDNLSQADQQHLERLNSFLKKVLPG